MNIKKHLKKFGTLSLTLLLSTSSGLAINTSSAEAKPPRNAPAWGYRCKQKQRTDRYNKVIAKGREVKRTRMMTVTKSAMTKSAMTAMSRKLGEADFLPEPFYLLNILGLNELLFGVIKDIL